MDKIYVKKCKSADTRSADTLVTKEVLLKSSEDHIDDVYNVLNAVIDELLTISVKHDFTKISDIEQFHSDFEKAQKREAVFTELPWYNKHISVERHHIDKYTHEDINLLDVLEHIADICSAGMARQGYVYDEALPDGLLEKAYQNTIKMIKDHIIVEE